MEPAPWTLNTKWMQGIVYREQNKAVKPQITQAPSEHVVNLILIQKLQWRTFSTDQLQQYTRGPSTVVSKNLHIFQRCGLLYMCVGNGLHVIQLLSQCENSDYLWVQSARHCIGMTLQSARHCIGMTLQSARYCIGMTLQSARYCIGMTLQSARYCIGKTLQIAVNALV